MNTRAAFARWFQGIALVSTVMIAGCSGGDTAEKYAITGEVTLDGKPLDGAVVTFTPLGSGAKTGAEVVDGEFSIAQEDGLTVGRYRVEFAPYVPPDFSNMHMPQQEAANVSNGTESTSRHKPAVILPRYNEASELFIDVPDDGKRHFPFKLSSAP